MEDRIKSMIRSNQYVRKQRWLRGKKDGSKDSKLGEYDYRGVRIKR